MKSTRRLALLFPAFIAVLLLLWGVKVLFTAFAWGSMVWAHWSTDQKGPFGYTWLVAYAVALLPAYLFTLTRSIQVFNRPESEAAHSWLADLGLVVLLVLLTFSARVAVTAWFPSPMHPPFRNFTGGVVPGFLATGLLLLFEVAVLVAIKNQTRRGQRPYPLLLPGVFALILTVWGGWVAFTGFTRGELPVIGWRTDHRTMFGWVWLAAYFLVLVPAYFYSICLGILGVIERGHRDDVARRNFWLLAVSNLALLCAITFFTRMAVTAWFPDPIHPPFSALQGGFLTGVCGSVVLGFIMLIYFRVARAF